MKMLTGIALTQLAATVALLYLLASPDRQGDVTQAAFASTGIAFPALPNQRVSESSDDEATSQIRAIFRQEIRALLDALALQESPGALFDAPTVSSQEYGDRLDLAYQELEFFIDRGEISNSEMADLQARIVRLDPESRRQMMSLLARAINSGKLHGQF